jgi:hypothetical protein
MKIEGSGSASGSISQRHGSADPDPHQNVIDPQHCFGHKLYVFSHSYWLVPLFPIPSKNIFPCRTSSVGNDILGFDSSGSVVNQPDHGSLDWVKVRPHHQHKFFGCKKKTRSLLFRYFTTVDLNNNFYTFCLLLCCSLVNKKKIGSRVKLG